MQTPSTRERINIAGVRARYPVDPVTIWRKCRKGDFPAPHYIGKRRFWFADEIEAWIAAQMALPRDSTGPLRCSPHVQISDSAAVQP